jgi:hypothetical protein
MIKTIILSALVTLIVYLFMLITSNKIQYNYYFYSFFGIIFILCCNIKEI